MQPLYKVHSGFLLDVHLCTLPYDLSNATNVHFHSATIILYESGHTI